jgi:putative ABC transport system permease protein
MGIFIRGIKNAFRNFLRTLSVTLILALSIGLALIMLLSYQTVQNRLTSVKSTIGNTITVYPAGAQGFQGGGEPLTADQLTVVKGIAHVSSVVGSTQDRLIAGSDNNLTSAIDAGTLGNRVGRQEQARTQSAPDPSRPFPAGGSTSGTARTFTVPIMVTGLSDPSFLTSVSTFKITSGSLFAANSTENVAVIGTALASKNNLTVGSTFTAYSTPIKVVAIFDAGNTFSNAGLYMPIAAVQTLSGQTNQYNSFTVTADSIENVDATVTAIKSKLGSDKVDVTSTKDSAEQSLAPLENIKNISLYSLIGSLVAGSVITLLIMIMIIRERRREIGVLKAIGASNIGIVVQFVTEALVLTVMGSVVGAVLGVVLSNPVLNVLITNSTSATATPSAMHGGRLGRFTDIGGQLGGGIRGAVTSLHATVGFSIILYGFLVAILIAVIGSAIPAWLIAKVKPAEVMRAE